MAPIVTESTLNFADIISVVSMSSNAIEPSENPKLTHLPTKLKARAVMVLSPKESEHLM